MAPHAKTGSRFNLLRLRLVLEAMLLGLVVGIVADHQDWEPAAFLRNGLTDTAFAVWLAKDAWFDGPPAAIGDHPPTGPVGFTRYGASAPGLILAATGGPEVTLLAPDGTVRHRWRIPVESLFTAPWLLRPGDVVIDGYRLLPDGSLLAIVSCEARFPGFRWSDVAMNSALVKIDAQSRLLWVYQGNPHHDLAMSESGDLYVLVARDGMQPSSKDDLLPSGFRDEGIAVLDAQGREQRTIWLAQALKNSPYAWIVPEFAARRCYRDTQYCWDLFHANSVLTLSAEVASKLPAAKPGDLLVNLRELDTVLVIDPLAGRVRWAMHGSWHRSHDVHATASGMLMMFDNLGNVGGLAPSRIVEIDPQTGATVWQYDGGRSHPFYSSIRGNAEPLANGDVLVTETMGGRIFEITRSGDIAWEYVSPPARNADTAPMLRGARLIEPADYPFLVNCPPDSCGAGSNQAENIDPHPTARQ